MRTTLVIDNQVFGSVKKLAAEDGTSVSAVVTEALRQFIDQKGRPAKKTTFRMPVFDGGGTEVDSSPSDFHRLDEEAELASFGS